MCDGVRTWQSHVVERTFVQHFYTHPYPQPSRCIFKSAKENNTGGSQGISKPTKNAHSGFVDWGKLMRLPLPNKCTRRFRDRQRQFCWMRLTAPKNASAGFADRQRQFLLMRQNRPQKCRQRRQRQNLLKAIPAPPPMILERSGQILHWNSRHGIL